MDHGLRNVNGATKGSIEGSLNFRGGSGFTDCGTC